MVLAGHGAISSISGLEHLDETFLTEVYEEEIATEGSPSGSPLLDSADPDTTQDVTCIEQSVILRQWNVISRLRQEDPEDGLRIPPSTHLKTGASPEEPGKDEPSLEGSQC